MDAGPPARRLSRRMQIFRVALVVAFVGSLIYMLFASPLVFELAVALIVIAAGSAAVFAAYFLPNKLSERLKRAFTVGAAAVGLITTLIAVPAIQDETATPQAGTSAASETPSTTPSPQPSTPSPLPDPLTATLRMGLDCEIFSLPNSQLQSLSKLPNLEAEWVYAHGGATWDADMILVVQGKTEEAVILERIRIIELERIPVPAEVATIGCDDFGGYQPNRSFDIKLSDPVRVVPRRGEKKPAPKFPYRVSASDPESFELEVSGPPCFCRYRLALDWISQGRSGTLKIGRGRGQISTDTSDSEELDSRPRHIYYDGDWEPPLPK